MKKVRQNCASLMLAAVLAMALSVFCPMAGWADDPIPPGGIIEGEVPCNPGFIKGTISLGDTSRNSVTATQVNLSATGIDAAGKAISGLTSNVTLKGAGNLSQYEMVVQIPTEVMNAGGTQRYLIHCTILYGRTINNFNFKSQIVEVPYGNQNAPKVVDFVVKPGFITGPLPTNCQIKSGSITAQLTGEVSTHIEFANTDLTKPANFYFPVQPNQDIQVWGVYTLTNGWTYQLEKRLVTVAEGQEVYPGWNIHQCGPDGDCSGTLKGQFGLEGLRTTDSIKKQDISLSGSTAASATFSTSGPYIFKDLKPGIHSVAAAIYLNNGDDTFIPPYTDYGSKYTGLSQVDVQCDPAVIKDITPKAAFVNGKLSFQKDATVAAFKADQDPEVPMVTPTWAAIWGYGLFETKGEGSYRNGYSSDLVNIDNGNYDLILSEGEWNVYHTEIQFYHKKWMDLCRDGKLRYVDSRMIVSDLGRTLRYNKQIKLSAGQTVDDNNFLFESGAATIRFYINGEGTMGNTNLTASRDPNDPLFKDMSVGLEASGVSSDGKTGEATLIGPPGTYNLIARAVINGSLTTFGDLKITLVAGACQSFEIGAPTLTLNVTNTCNNEVTVNGKATDKMSPIQSVKVNGQNIAFTATGNADNEVTFNITLPLQAGENKIETEVMNNAGKTVSDSRTLNSYSAGTFVVGDEGLVNIDWLYDGGKYQGQFGIFSLGRNGAVHARFA